MTPIDFALLSFVALLAIFGFIRGVISQAMSIAGLVAAYFFSVQLSEHVVAKIAEAMGSTQAYARPFAVLWAAILIYIGCRLVGFAIEKVFVNQSDSLKSLNRVGGGFLGAIKGCLVLLIAFYILRLVPQDTLEARAPKIQQSKMYQFFAHNQLFNQEYIDTLAAPVTKSAQDIIQSKEVQQNLPKSVTLPKNKKTIEKTENKMNQEELNKILQQHDPVVVSDGKKTPAAKPKAAPKKKLN